MLETLPPKAVRIFVALAFFFTLLPVWNMTSIGPWEASDTLTLFWIAIPNTAMNIVHHADAEHFLRSQIEWNSMTLLVALFLSYAMTRFFADLVRRGEPRKDMFWALFFFMLSFIFAATDKNEVQYQAAFCAIIMFFLGALKAPYINSDLD